MIQKKIVPGSLLYHAAHGLCRVRELMDQKANGMENLFYCLVPKLPNRMKMRFVIPASGIKESGFHSLVPAEEADLILHYFKSGDESVFAAASDTEHQAVDFAKEIFSMTLNHKPVIDQRSRQKVKRMVNGLVGELAIVLKKTIKETAELIRKQLGHQSAINALVISALEQAGEN